MSSRLQFRIGSIVAVILVTSPLAGAVTLPPPPAEPALAALLGEAQKEFAAISAQGYFDATPTSATWPCATDDRELRSWAYALGTDELSDKDRRNYIRMFRDMGLQGGKQTLRDLKIGPVAATCKEGKLDGQVEYWVDNLRDMQGPNFSSTAKEQKRVRVSVLGGELSAKDLMVVSRRDSQKVMKMSDPNIQKFLDKNGPDKSETFSVTVTSPDVADVTIMETRGGLTPASTTVVYNVMTARGRRESRVYMDGQYFSLFHMKDNKLHGSYETFPVKLAGSVPSEGMKKCYENGEEVKVVTCNVD